MQKKDVFCNKCGNKLSSCDISDGNHNFYFDFGYASHHDGEKINFDLCGSCLDEALESLVRTFKHTPEGWKENEYVDLTPEEHQKIFEHWKETGNWDELMFYTYEQLIELNGWFNTEGLNEVIKKLHPDKQLLVDPHTELNL